MRCGAGSLCPSAPTIAMHLALPPAAALGAWCLRTLRMRCGTSPPRASAGSACSVRNSWACLALGPPLRSTPPSLPSSPSPAVVVGKDAVPRASVGNLARLVDEMVNSLARCRQPKLKAREGGRPGAMHGGAMHGGAVRTPSSARAHSLPQPPFSLPHTTPPLAQVLLFPWWRRRHQFHELFFPYDAIPAEPLSVLQHYYDSRCSGRVCSRERCPVVVRKGRRRRMGASGPPTRDRAQPPRHARPAGHARAGRWACTHPAASSSCGAGGALAASRRRCAVRRANEARTAAHSCPAAPDRCARPLSTPVRPIKTRAAKEWQAVWIQPEDIIGGWGRQGARAEVAGAAQGESPGQRAGAHCCRPCTCLPPQRRACCSAPTCTGITCCPLATRPSPPPPTTPASWRVAARSRPSGGGSTGGQRSSSGAARRGAGGTSACRHSGRAACRRCWLRRREGADWIAAAQGRRARG